MWMLAFFVLCLFCFVAGLYLVKDSHARKNSLMLSLIGFAVGFFIEYWGTTGGRWEYGETDIVMVANIPVEVIVGYGTGMFLLGLLIYYLFRFYDENDRVSVLKLFPFIGFVLFVVALLHSAVPLVVGMGFLAFWGLEISQKRSIPLLVGFVTFIADIVVEGGLYTFADYYEWDIGIAFSFMLIGIFIAGLLTRKRCRGNGDFCFVEG